MLEVNGQRYITAVEAPEYLGSDVKSSRVHDWKRRRLVTGYKMGGLVWFRLDELIEVEFITRRSPGGRPRG